MLVSLTNALQPLWNKIWGLKVPNKVKHFVWKACKNSLPTKVNLVRRKVITDGLCDKCKQGPEDVVHALYGCPTLDDLWKQTKWNNGALKYFTSFLDLFDFILASNSDVELFASTTWNLWNRRNNLRLGKPTIPLDKVLEHSREQQLESHFSTPLISTCRKQQDSAWTAPDHHWVKVNFDGATFAKDNKAGLGVVIRNDAGLVMASLSQLIPLPTSVIEVELMAARRALELALECGFQHTVLEGDSEVLYKALKQGNRCLAHYGHLITDIQFLISHFNAFKLSVVRRHSNKLAHALARRATVPPFMSVLMEDVPSDVLSVFQADLNSLT